MPKTALAGVMLDTSFARFMASIATLNEEGVPPCPFGRRDLISMNQRKAVARTRREVEVANKVRTLIALPLPRALCKHSHPMK